MNKEEKSLKEEIRREFQLERIMLFTDAVFAIAITLMAIEIRLPEHSSESFAEQLHGLVPVVLAYTASFAFIGQIWYQHLQIFAFLKDYDKGLVFRNLLMLFFVGLFPFSASLIATGTDYFITAAIYFFVIFFCKSAQLFLRHYILVKRPDLCIRADKHLEFIRYKKDRITVIMFVVCFILLSTTMYLISDPDMKYVGWYWFFLFPIALRFFHKRVK